MPMTIARGGRFLGALLLAGCASAPPAGGGVESYSASADTVYNTNRDLDTVSVVSIAAGRVVRTIAVGSRPIGIALDAAGTRAYAANSGSGSVSVIDVATQRTVATICGRRASLRHRRGSFGQARLRCQCG